jgi:hypothetical protein
LLRGCALAGGDGDSRKHTRAQRGVAAAAQIVEREKTRGIVDPRLTRFAVKSGRSWRRLRANMFHCSPLPVQRVIVLVQTETLAAVKQGGVARALVIRCGCRRAVSSGHISSRLREACASNGEQCV